MAKALRKVPRLSPAQALRGTALQELDSLLESAATLRVELRDFETSLRRARVHLERGKPAAAMHDVLDINATRDALTRAANDFQAHRATSRLSIFRLQVAEGLSIGAIARVWGLSRQLVSRALREDAALKAGSELAS